MASSGPGEYQDLTSPPPFFFFTYRANSTVAPTSTSCSPARSGWLVGCPLTLTSGLRGTCVHLQNRLACEMGGSLSQTQTMPTLNHNVVTEEMRAQRVKVLKPGAQLPGLCLHANVKRPSFASRLIPLESSRVVIPQAREANGRVGSDRHYSCTWVGGGTLVGSLDDAS